VKIAFAISVYRDGLVLVGMEARDAP